MSKSDAESPLDHRTLHFDNRDSLIQHSRKNKITNARYTLWNFVPKNLSEQFKSFMNKYFLLIAVLELWSSITPVHPVTTWAPLLFVFAISAAKQAWDDIGRHKSDKKENERSVSLFHQNSFRPIECQEVCPGNILFLSNNEEIPCDMILLASSNEDGSCFVHTAALDGESDLKLKSSPPCRALPLSFLTTLNGDVEYVCKKEDISDFEVTLSFSPPFPHNSAMDLNSENVLLRSSFLRNTEWVYALAIATGEETKMACNRGNSTFMKTTFLEKYFDQLVIFIFIFQFFTILVLGAIGDIFKERTKTIFWYVSYSPFESFWRVIIIPLRFQLLFSIMIPISLKVTMDIVKSYFSKLIDWDMNMFDFNSQSHAHTNNSNIVEDLGQVDLILTDKTGTLTCNDLNFKFCCIDGYEYGNDGSVDDYFFDEALQKKLMEKRFSEFFFFLNFVLCNTCVPCAGEDGAIEFQSQSQDEHCLIQTACKMGCNLVSRLGKLTELRYFEGNLKFELLEMLKFSSERRKMSVIVRDMQTDQIFLFSKGADEAILPFIVENDKMKTMVDKMEDYSCRGFRTLCYSFREINAGEYESWHHDFKQNYFKVQNQEDIALGFFETIEKGSSLLGISAIEDKLQENVVECISDLRSKGGIKFWMATGDKKSTAVQTAIYANLISIDASSKCFELNGRDESSIHSSISNHIETLQPGDSYAVVIDGITLDICLSSASETPHDSPSPSPFPFPSPSFIFDFLLKASSVICCRANPAQKAQMVKLVEGYGMCVLAIGDGSNDVAMIRASSVGVAITSSSQTSSVVGHHSHASEGYHASKAADVTIPGFRHLRSLLLVHGRYAFFRLSFIIQYSIYKSFLLCVTQMLFGYWSQFSGSNLFDSTSLMLYNAVYTCLPPLLYVLNKDVHPSSSLACPHLLLLFKRNSWFNYKTILRWYACAVYHSFLVWFVCLFTFPYVRCQQEMMFSVFSACLFLVILMAILETHCFSLMQHASFFLSFLLLYVLNWLFSFVTNLCDLAEAMLRLCSSADYWMMLGVVIVLGVGPFLIYKYIRFHYFPNLIEHIQALEHKLGDFMHSRSKSKPEAKACICNSNELTKTEIEENRNPLAQRLLSTNSDEEC